MDSTIEFAAQELRRLGLNAVSWDSGGGMEGIGVADGGSPPDEINFFFGTAGECWAGEVLDDEGEIVGGIETDVPSDSVSPRTIAAGILGAMARFAAANAAG